MADQPTSTETTTTSTIDPAIKAELDQQMAISLNNGVAPASPTTDSPVSGAEPPTPPITEIAPTDPFSVFRDKFGYASPEAAIQDIEALRAFKASPPVAEFKFENEETRKVLEALQKGDYKPVYEVLDQQMRIDRLTGVEMNADTAAEIVKYGMQLKYKDLTSAEINYKFNKQFGLPPKPSLLPAEDQEEYNQRIADWQALVEDKKMDLMIEAKQLKPDLLAAKSKLVFPTIAQQHDENYLQWQKTVQENDRLAAETTQAYKAFTPKSIETKFNFVDDASKIAFDFQFEPDADSFNQVVDLVSDMEKFQQSYLRPDGTPDRERFLRDIYFAKNREKILTLAILQGKNAAIKASLPDNSTGGLVRQMPQSQEPNELDKMMRLSLKGYGGF